MLPHPLFRLIVSHAKRWLLALAIAFGFACETVSALAPWDSCASGSAPMVRNPNGSESGLQSLLPSGDYYPDELRFIVDGYQSTYGCTSPDVWTDVQCYQVTSSTTYICTRQCQRTNGSAAHTVSAQGQRVCATQTCPLQIGRTYDAGAFVFFTGTASSTACLQGCELEFGGFGLVIGGEQPPLTATVTSDTCTLADNGYGIADDLQCITTVNGVEVCRPPATSTPCVTLDGSEVCQSELLSHDQLCAAGLCTSPEDPVLDLANGAQVAPDGTPSPPAPDSGAAGNAASPDETLTVYGSDGTSSNWNYWTPGTVQGSSTYTPGGDGGGGDGDGEGEGTGSITGGLDCDAPPVCDGDPIQCYHSHALWAYNCSLQSAPANQLEAEVNRFTDPTPEDGTILDVVTHDVSQLVVPYTPGPCPSDIPIALPAPFNTTVTVPISEWCTLLTILGAFVHLGAAWTALRILGS